MTHVLNRIFDAIDAAPAEAEVLNWLFRDQLAAAQAGVPLVLYGAGAFGKDLAFMLSAHGLKPTAFCSSDASQIGKTQAGLPILGLDELSSHHRQSLILVATQTHAASVVKMLLDMGFARSRVIWPSDFDMLLGLYFSYSNQSVLQCMRERSTDHFRDVLHAHEAKIQSVYDLLADAKSRELFVAKLAFLARSENLHLFRRLMTGFSEPISEFGLIPFQGLGPENYCYFNNDVFSPIPDETYVDVGAFDGDSVTTFVEAFRRRGIAYKKVHAFEPDPKNFEALVKNTSGFEAIECHRKGLWSTADVLRFESSEKAFSTTASCITDAGDIEVEVVPLDDFLNGESISLIKMDPPGNIIPDVLQGGTRTISRCKPRMVLNAYNTFEDIFEIPAHVHSLWPDYRLHLRHVSWTVSETDLFACL